MDDQLRVKGGQIAEKRTNKLISSKLTLTAMKDRKELKLELDEAKVGVDEIKAQVEEIQTEQRATKKVSLDVYLEKIKKKLGLSLLPNY